MRVKCPACWRSPPGSGPSCSRSGCDGTGRSSLFLTAVLRPAGHDDAEWCCGAPGDHAAAVGYHDGTGWRGHAWAELEGHVLDITANQFGQRSVLLLPAPNPRYRRGSDRTHPQPGPRGCAAGSLLPLSDRHGAAF